MTVLYDSKNTLKIIFSINGSVWPKVLPFCLLTVALTAVVYILKKEDILDLTINEVGHKILSIMVAFLVVSRVNSAYERFWDARTLLSTALCSFRQLSSHVAIFTNKEKSEKAEKWRALVLERILELLDTSMNMLQDEDFHDDKTIGYLENDFHDKGIPKRLTLMVNELQQIIVAQEKYLENPLEIQKELRLHELIEAFMSAIVELVKYPATPYPFPTAQMSRILLFLWIFTLPLPILNNEDNSVVVPSVCMFFITYGFFGLEFVSIELDDPFGDDANDLEIQHLSRTIKDGIRKDLDPKSMAQDLWENAVY